MGMSSGIDEQGPSADLCSADWGNRFDVAAGIRKKYSVHLNVVVVRALLPVCLAVSSGCSYVSGVVSTGARSAIVVLVRPEVTTAGSAPLPMPSRDEIKSALSHHFLWLADDERAGQWIAYLEARTPPTPLQPFALTLLEVKKNPAWDPLAVSSPFPTRGMRVTTAHDLLEQYEKR